MLYITNVQAADPLSRFERLLMPGPLSKAHHKYENDCSQCHTAFKKDFQNDRCMACHDHKNIKQDVAENTGYHGRIPGIHTKPCRDCHTEHTGADGKLILFNPQTFNHTATDFALSGAHLKANCKSCHKSGQAWHKAPVDCYSCHKEVDNHRGNLGKQCNACHGTENWTSFAFDHDKTDFKLDGQHKNKTCVVCHPNNQYKLDNHKCISCHKASDVHKGLWGEKCETCHSSNGWINEKFNHKKQAKYELKESHANTGCAACHPDNPYKNQTPDKCVDCHQLNDQHKGLYGKKCHDCHTEKKWSDTIFDHDKTDYRLKGKHEKVACNACHPGDLYKTKTPTKCIDCHIQHDVHNTTQGKNCQTCHSEKGWQNNVIFDHQLSSFPLLGVHSTLACEECHSNNSFNQAKTPCISCHKAVDYHRKALGDKCEQCHFPADWKAWRFDHDKQTKFKLTGSHAKIACAACHFPNGDSNLKLPMECVDCHLDDDIHEGAFGSVCGRCHNTKSFKEAKLL